MSALSVEKLDVRHGLLQAVRDVSFAVECGETLALVGANGAGKTTLLKTVSGVVRARSGHIRLFSQDVTHHAPDRRVRLGIGQVPEGRQVFGGLNVEDNLLLGAYTRRDAARKDDLERMYALFPILKEKRRLAAGTLSGGQQQMLAMARALMSRPKILLLDEPSMGLAPLLVKEIFNVIARLKGEGIPILLVEQNAHAALSVADYGYVLETGRIVTSGPGETLLQDDKVREAYLGM
jgi:branched-chain amino acid transport system ATP-binding protein